MWSLCISAASARLSLDPDLQAPEVQVGYRRRDGGTTSAFRNTVKPRLGLRVPCRSGNVVFLDGVLPGINFSQARADAVFLEGGRMCQKHV